MDTYRVLIALTNATEREHARAALLEAGENIVAEAATRAELDVQFRHHRPEVVLLDSALLPLSPEERELLHPTALVVVRPAEADATTLENITHSAAFGTLPAAFTSDDATAELALAASRNADLLECNMQLDKAQTRLADRIAVERAKGILIERERLSEPEAFKQIHYAARRANRTMRDVADEIIAQHAEGMGGA